MGIKYNSYGLWKSADINKKARKGGSNMREQLRQKMREMVATLGKGEALLDYSGFNSPLL